MGVLSFTPATAVQPALRGDGAGFFAGGQFTVRIRFDERDCEHLEYRQYIRGTATLQHGMFIGARLPGNWRATGQPVSQAHNFAVPGGLRSNYREDGETRHGRVYRFGYRRGDGVQEEGLEDRYLPHPDGPEYRLRDTWGLRGTSRPRATRIQIWVQYKGTVIDTRRPDRPIETREWSYRIDDLFP